jgi:hypothetical protein
MSSSNCFFFFANVKTLSHKFTHSQASSIRDAVWKTDWVGTPVSFQRCLVFIIAVAGKKFSLTAGKYVPVSNNTLLNVRKLFDMTKCEQ